MIFPHPNKLSQKRLIYLLNLSEMYQNMKCVCVLRKDIQMSRRILEGCGNTFIIAVHFVARPSGFFKDPQACIPWKNQMFNFVP